MFLNEKDYEKSSSLFMKWETRPECMILLFADLYPRGYIEEYLVNKLKVDVKKIMPAGFNLFDYEQKPEIKMQTSLITKLSETFRTKLLSSDGPPTE